MSNIYVKSSVIQRGREEWEQMDIHDACIHVGNEIRGILTVIHAFGGSGTTSRIFEKGKILILKPTQKNPSLPRKVSLFGQQLSTMEDITKVRVEFLCSSMVGCQRTCSKIYALKAM